MLHDCPIYGKLNLPFEDVFHNLSFCPYRILWWYELIALIESWMTLGAKWEDCFSLWPLCIGDILWGFRHRFIGLDVPSDIVGDTYIRTSCVICTNLLSVFLGFACVRVVGFCCEKYVINHAIQKWTDKILLEYSLEISCMHTLVNA